MSGLRHPLDRLPPHIERLMREWRQELRRGANMRDIAHGYELANAAIANGEAVLAAFLRGEISWWREWNRAAANIDH
jgi:hypothetical protein